MEYLCSFAFCIKKAKNSNSTSDNKTKETNKGQTDNISGQMRQRETIDKLIKGLGVSLAKTPCEFCQTSKTDNPKNGYSMPFFLCMFVVPTSPVMFVCLFVFRFVEYYGM